MNEHAWSVTVSPALLSPGIHEGHGGSGRELQASRHAAPHLTSLWGPEQASVALRKSLMGMKMGVLAS